MEKSKISFNERLIKVLNWVGAIGAAVTAVAYMVFIVVLVVGFDRKMEMQNLLVVAIVGAVAGLCITWMMKGQGVSLAADEEDSKTIMKEYYKARNKSEKTKKLRTIKSHLVISGFYDVMLKGVTLAVTTYLSISIFMEGNGDFSLIGMALVNILMFTCFGMIAMSKYYKLYKEEHLPAIVEMTERLRSKADALYYEGNPSLVEDKRHHYENETQPASVPVKEKEDEQLQRSE